MEFVTNSKSQWNYRYLRFTIKSRYIVFVLLLVSHEPHNFISKIYNEVIYVYIQYFFFRELVVNHFSAHQCEQCLMLSLLFLSKRIWTGTQSQSQLDKGEYLNGKIWCSAEREREKEQWRKDVREGENYLRPCLSHFSLCVVQLGFISYPRVPMNLPTLSLSGNSL